MVNQEKQPNANSASYYTGDEGEIYFKTQKIYSVLTSKWTMIHLERYFENINSVLDFGCGGGYFLKNIKAQTKVGVEINPKAREEAAKLGLEVFEELTQLPDIKFDLIISKHALEHVTSPFEILRQIWPFLADDGKLIILVPLDDWRVKSHRQYTGRDNHHHIYNWTPQNFGNLLESVGYSNIQIKILHDAMPPFFKLSNFILKNKLLTKYVGVLFSFLMKRRQLLAIAMK